ncbi:MAG: nitroreductase family protein [Acidimicrobiales bacterium]
MTIDTAAVDAALTTTRAVRLRLDLDRDVDDQILLDCIDVAEQAPTGGNQGSRRWIIVRDPEVKQQLAQLYLDAAGSWMIQARDQLVGTGHPQEKTLRSAAHLAEHLAEVPAIVIPTILGTHDGSGRPGLFDSVIQAAWSFCVALRARGLGTAWTTAILAKTPELRQLLRIPEGTTEIAMFPVAWTKGTEFGTAFRHPARAITYFDRYARTYESGPSTPIRLADGPGTVVEVDIDAPVEAVWSPVCDINMPAAYSEEFLGADWDDPAVGPAQGARFVGRNANSFMGEWEVPCFVDAYERHRVFGWCTSDPDHPGARWRFELEPLAGTTRLRFRVILGPGPSGLTAAIAEMPDDEARIIGSRLKNLRANMQRVVEGIKKTVETSDGDPT